MKILMMLVCMMLSLSTYASEHDACAINFAEGYAPKFVTNYEYKQGSIELCSDGHATLHSGVTRTPLWSASHLTRDRVVSADALSREDSFREDSRLPEKDQAQLSDYYKSGYDRGHVAPNGDMATRSQQYASFSLSNIAPQNAHNNRVVWRDVEMATRNLAKLHNEVYVVTGVTFQHSHPEVLQGRVTVPSHFYKAVYIPSTGEASVYYASNDDSGSLEILSVSELREITGIDVFPALDAKTSITKVYLPKKPGDLNPELSIWKKIKQALANLLIKLL